MNDEQLKAIHERLNYLEFALRSQISRIYELEKSVGLAPVPETAPEPVLEPRLEPAVEPAGRVEAAPVEVEAAAAPVPSEPEPVILTGQMWEGERKRFSLPADNRELESLIGGTWFNRIGILAIVLAVGYFLREAFRRGWIGPQGRVMIGVATGLGLLFAGEKLRGKGYRNYAFGLSGGGISILYLTFFAAYDRYQLVSQPAAFLLMSLVTVTAVLLAARYDALAIAILGLLGGFLTPYMVSSGKDNQTGLFTYIALLDLGVLAVAYFKQWRALNYLAFIGTVVITAGWMDEYYAPEKLWKTVFFLTLLFLIFAALAVLHNIVNLKPAGPLDLGMIFSNAGAYFGACYGILEKDYHPYLGLFAVVMSAFYLGLGYLTYTRDREDRYLIMTFIGVSAVFLTLAVPIQLDQHWVTMSWALEAAVLTWIGTRARSAHLMVVSLVIFFISISHWLMFDLVEAGFTRNPGFMPIANKRTFSAAVLCGAMALAAYLHHKYRDEAAVQERQLAMAFLGIAANLIALVALSSDVLDYFSKLRAGVSEASANPVNDLNDWYNNLECLSMTLLWALHAMAALLAGFRWRAIAARAGGLLLLTVTIVKVIVVDSGHFEDSWHRLLLNPTFASWLAVIVASGITVVLYSRAEWVAAGERKIGLTGGTIVLNLLAVSALSAESSCYFERRMDYNRPYEEMRPLALARQLTLSVIWTVYGGAMLLYGIRRDNRLLRWMALGLLALSILKVFLVDLSNLDTIYRIVSFIVLGVILLAVSFFYQQRQKRVEEGGPAE